MRMKMNYKKITWQILPTTASAQSFQFRLQPIAEGEDIRTTARK
jgi:hypothetical protein